MGNVDNMLKKMLGKAKSKPVIKPLRMGASIPMQKQWKSFSKPKQVILRKKFKDSDGDGVPNKWDCQPHNKFKQDGWKFWERKKERTPGEWNIELTKHKDEYKEAINNKSRGCIYCGSNKGLRNSLCLDCQNQIKQKQIKASQELLLDTQYENLLDEEYNR